MCIVKDANGKHPVAPGVLYVIHKYDYKKNLIYSSTKKFEQVFGGSIQSIDRSIY